MFKPVENYEPLEVNDKGVVRNKNTGKVLSVRKNKGGYCVVSHKGSPTLVHRLVAIAFLPNPEDKPCVNHIDSVRDNNELENLEWCTYQENAIHGNVFGFGLDKYTHGESSNFAIHTEETIREVCKLLVDGYRGVDIEKITGIHKALVSDIKRGKRWSSVSKDYFENESAVSKKSELLSETTVKWICYKIIEGLTNSEIVKLTKNVTYRQLRSIKDRKTYTDITKDFVW